MAKQIKRGDIIEDGILSEHLKQLQEALKLYKSIDEQIKTTAKTAKGGIGPIDPNSAKGIKQINAEVSNSIKLRKASLDIQKKQEQLKQSQIKTENAILAQKKKSATEEKKRIKLLRESSSAYKKQSKELADLRRRFKDLAVSGRGAGKVARGLLIDIKKLNAGLVKADTSAGQFGRVVGRYPKALGRARSGLKQFAGALGLTSGIFLLVQGLKDAFSLFTKFGQAQANLASILGKSKGEIKDLTDEAKRLGSVTANTASEITELQTELSKLGFNKQEILDSTEAIQRLSQATGTDLAQSATQVGSVLRSFNLDATEAGRVADVMASSTSKSALDMTKLATALPVVSKTANVAGASLEQTTAMLGVLSDTGIDASTSATALRNIFLETAKSGTTLEDAFAQINQSTNKNATAMQLFGKRGATVAITLAENTDKTKSLTQALLESGGTAEEMAETQMDTLQGSVTLLKSAYEGFILSLEDGDGEFGKWIRNTVDATAVVFNLLSGIEQTDEALQSLRFGDTIVKVKNFIDTWSVAFESVENLKQALADTADILTTIITFGLIDNVSEDYFGLAKSVEKYDAEQRKAINTTAIAQFGIKKLSASVVEYTAKEQSRITALAEGNLTQDQRNALIADLNEKYPELIKNYDLENLSQEDAIRLNQELKKEIIDIAILKEKSLALTFLNIEVEKERDRISKITSASVRKQKLEELEFTKRTQLERIDAIEKETRIRLGLAEEEKETVEDLNEETITTAEDGYKSQTKTFKTESEKRIDQAEIEEKRLHDLRTQRQKDVADNDKENAAIRKKTAEDKQKEIDKNNANQEKSDEQNRENIKKAQEKQLANFKESAQLANDLLNALAENLEAKLDSQIQASQGLIQEGNQAVTTLEARAAAGNLQAQESIKSEKQRISQERLKIEELEKKKRDLLIVVTGLNLLNQKIQAGDGSAISNASGELNGFISGLEGFYEGTNTTLGSDIRGALPISGDRDTHIIKAHKDEHIIGVENSRKLKGMNQEQIVEGALMYKNNEFVGRRAIVNVNKQTAFNDSRMVNALNNNTKTIARAIENIPESHSDYDAVNKIWTDSVRRGNKTVRTHKKWSF